MSESNCGCEDSASPRRSSTSGAPVRSTSPSSAAVTVFHTSTLCYGLSVERCTGTLSVCQSMSPTVVVDSMFRRCMFRRIRPWPRTLAPVPPHLPPSQTMRFAAADLILPPAVAPLPEFEVRGRGRRCPSPRPLPSEADVRPPSLLFPSSCALDDWGNVSASSHSPSCVQPCDRIHITKKRQSGTILPDKGVATHAHNNLDKMGDQQ